MARGDVLAEHMRERLALYGRHEKETAAKLMLRAMSDEEFREAYKVWRTEYMRRWRAKRKG